MQARREWLYCKCGRTFKPDDFEIYEGEVWIICENCRERVIKYRNLSWETKEALLKRDRAFDYDIKTLFDKDLISFVDYEDVKSKLRTKEAKDYLESIIKESEPEDALDEYLFQKDATIGRILRWRKRRDKTGKKPDYSLDEKKFIAIELKSLFERDKRGLRQKELKWERWKRQIYNYTRETKYLVLTNYKKWYFFNAKDCISEDKCKPFYECGLFGFLGDFKKEGDLKEFLVRREREAEEEDLDERFFRNLGEWVRVLEEIDFEVSEAEKKEAIIGLINKFIFIDTLDDFQVIEPLWVRNHWNKCEGKTAEFLRSTNMHFFLKYDTELFKDDFIAKVNGEESNLTKLKQGLKTVLGLSAWQGISKEFKGITQYKFRNINEDIFGKAYEKYLASLRKERGIYYTPSYVTEYIVENTVGAVFDALLSEFKEELGTLSSIVARRRGKEKEINGLKKRRIEIGKRILLREKLRKELEEIEKEGEKSNAALKKIAKRFIEVKIFDPACGSGSFLIKAMRLTWKKYKELGDILKGYYGKTERGIYRDIKKLAKLEGSDRELISCIILRHIHGVDLDERALSVAKVNIWEEGVKISSESFKEDRLPKDAIHILPNLEMNLRSGDSLVGLPEDLTVKYLQENHREEIIKLFRLREEYLNNPAKVEKVEEIEEIKDGLRKELGGEFERSLKERDLPLEIVGETKPFHWALEFWYAFFDENGEALPEEERGVNAVVGNPPYVTLALGKGQKFISKDVLAYLTDKFQKSSEYKGNTYALFMEQGLRLLKNRANLGFIIPNTLLTNHYFRKMREYVLNTCKITHIVNISGKVFKDAEIGGNAIPILEREKNADLRDGNKIKIVKVEDVGKFSKNLFDIEVMEQGLFWGMPDKKFLLEKANAILINRIEKNCVRLGENDVATFYNGIKTGDNKRFLSNNKESEIHREVLRGRDISRYFLEFGNNYVLFDKDKLWSNTDEKMFLAEEKIIVRQTSDHLVGAYDNNQYFTLDSTHLIIPRQLNTKYTLALINSELMNFYYRILVPETGKTFAEVKIINLKKLPIFLATPEQQKPITELVDRIILLKRAYHKLLTLWKEWSDNLTTKEETLLKIITGDFRLIGEGEFEKTWITKASFNPEGKRKPESLTKQFDKLETIGDYTYPILRIYRLEGKDEEKIYEITFRNRDLMLHVYSSLVKTLESKAKIKTLAGLLAKATVPIIKEVNKTTAELTPNILRKAEEEFEEWKKKEGIKDVESDIVRVSNEIEEVDAKIDALVFELYGLDRKEVVTVLESLNVTEMMKNNILMKFGGANAM